MLFVELPVLGLYWSDARDKLNTRYVITIAGVTVCQNSDEYVYIHQNVDKVIRCLNFEDNSIPGD